MRKEATLTVLLVFVVVALILGMKFAAASFQEGDARKYVVEDLQTRYPYADNITVVASEQRTNDMGETYYWIKAAVSDGLDGPCPTRTNYYYNYPEQNFVPAPPEYVVRNCRVCAATPCVIAFEEEAIIASHALMGGEAVHAYVTSHTDAEPSVRRTSAGWVVDWTSSAEYGYEVVVSTDGLVVSVKQT